MKNLNKGANVLFVEHFDNDDFLEINEKGIIKDYKNSPLGIMYLVKFTKIDYWIYHFQVAEEKCSYENE